ncbi:phage holin family protein [Pseudomonas aeruginosa]|uniref:phage holin family protein n=1 Tax=Pseudomonas aeruginosa TaxID=287 RepID=UPI003DA86027
MVDLVTLAAAAVCGAISCRIFTYQRHGATYRFGISCLAWLVMGSAGSAALYILKGWLVVPPHAWPLVVLLGVFAWALFRTRGNLARVWRIQ